MIEELLRQEEVSLMAIKLVSFGRPFAAVLFGISLLLIPSDQAHPAVAVPTTSSSGNGQACGTSVSNGNALACTITSTSPARARLTGFTVSGAFNGGGNVVNFVTVSGTRNGVLQYTFGLNSPAFPTDQVNVVFPVPLESTSQGGTIQVFVPGSGNGNFVALSVTGTSF
jgi:hypothetical protein